MFSVKEPGKETKNRDPSMQRASGVLMNKTKKLNYSLTRKINEKESARGDPLADLFCLFSW